MIPTQTETLEFNVDVEHEAVVGFTEEIKTVLGGSLPATTIGDTLTVCYKVHVDYFDDVYSRLTALKTILANSAVISRCELSELVHGESMIVSVLDALRGVQAEIEKRAEGPNQHEHH